MAVSAESVAVAGHVGPGTEPVETGVAALRALVLELTTRVERLEATQRRRPPRSLQATDYAALLIALREAVGDRNFTVREIIAHAVADGVLRCRLESLRLNAVDALGYALRSARPLSQRGKTGTWRLDRVHVDGNCVLWQVAVAMPSPSSSPLPTRTRRAPVRG